MKILPLIGIGTLASFAIACSTSSSLQEHTRFSRADSLTDVYLVLNDSVLQSWNRMMGNEISKSRTLQGLIEDLDEAKLLTEETRESFAIRIEQLEKIRFTQQSISDSQVVADYDLALQSIIEDLSDLVPSSTSADPQSLLKYFQQSTSISRLSYDSLARSFNDFLEKNKSVLKDLEANDELEEKPLFVKIK